MIHPGQSRNGRERKPQEFAILSQVLKILILLFGMRQTVTFFQVCFPMYLTLALLS